MPIRVKCSCGKALSVKDELAGKKVKCPGCSSAIPIPKPAAVPVKKPADDDDDDDGSPYDLHAKDRGPTPEEIAEAERKRKKRVKEAEAKAEENKQTDKLRHFIVGGVALLLLILLGVAPFLNWFSLSNSGISSFDLNTLYSQKTTLLGGQWDKEGKIFIGVSFLMALLVGAGLVLYGVLEDEAAEHGFSGPSCLAIFWTIATFIWSLGFTWWWIFIQRYKFEEALKTNLGANISALPGPGMIVALVASALAAGALSYSVMKRGDTGWCYLAQFLGVALGAALIGLDVKPW